MTAIGLHGAGYDLTGMTPIGLLPVLFGTNGTIAWAAADLNARYFVPYIKSATATLPVSDLVRKAADALVAWDMRLRDADKDGRHDGPGVTILQAWLKAMTAAVLKDDLPAGVFNSLVDLGYAPLTGGAREACSAWPQRPLFCPSERFLRRSPLAP